MADFTNTKRKFVNILACVFEMKQNTDSADMFANCCRTVHTRKRVFANTCSQSSIGHMSALQIILRRRKSNIYSTICLKFLLKQIKKRTLYIIKCNTDLLRNTHLNGYEVSKIAMRTECSSLIQRRSITLKILLLTSSRQL